MVALLSMAALLSGGDGWIAGSDTSAAQDGGIVVRQVWAGADVNPEGTPTPDGRHFVFTDWTSGDIAVRDLTSGATRRLTANGELPFAGGFGMAPVPSPDGTQVAYTWFNQKFYEIQIVSLAAGQPEPRIVFQNPGLIYLQPFAWSPDGTRLLTLVIRDDVTNHIALIGVADGVMRILKSLEWRYPLKMSMSPDGRYVAYDRPVRQDSADRDVFVVAVDGSTEVPLVQHPALDYGPVWTPDGDAVIFASDRRGSTALWATRFVKGKPEGVPRLVKPDVGNNVSPFRFARDGSYYYSVRTGTEDVYAADLNPDTGVLLGEPKRLTERFTGSNLAGIWSPDGRRIAYVSRRGPLLEGLGAMALVIRSLDGAERDLFSILTFDRRRPLLSWFPDGRSLLLRASDGRGRWIVHRLDVQTGRTMPVTRPLGTPGFVFQPPVLAADGRTMYFLHNNAQPSGENRCPCPQSLIAHDLGTGRQRELWRQTEPHLLVPALSRSGKDLAFVTSERHPAVVAMPATGGPPRELFRAPAGTGDVVASGLAWTRDDRFILFVRRSLASRSPDTPTQLWRIPREGSEPQRVLEADMDGLAFPSIAPDGRRLLFTAGRSGLSEIWAMQNLLRPGS